MIQKEVLAYIRKYHMISPGEICLVGLSGGADSVCLLLLLAEFQEKLQCFLQAVHINHRIRGAEAERDAFYCRKLCQERGFLIMNILMMFCDLQKKIISERKRWDAVYVRKLMQIV